MKFGRQRLLLGTMALGSLAAPALLIAQAAASPVQQQQQQVPDAPAPQTLPRLSPISQPAPALPPMLPGAAEQTDTTSNLAPPLAPPDVHPDDGEAPKAAKPGDFTMAAVNVQFVQLPFTVKDSKNRLVPGLTWRDVRVFENGVREQPRFFTTDPFPLSVAIVIDQSVTYDTMEKINDSLSALQGAFTPYDSVALFTYNNGAKKQTDFTAAQSPRLTALLERTKGAGRDPVMGMASPLENGIRKNGEPIDGVQTMGHPAGDLLVSQPREYHTLLDAIFMAAQTAATADRGRRRIVFVISDGKELGSKIKEKDLIKYLERNKIEVYATLVGDSSIPGLGFLDRIHLPLTMRDNVLPRIANVTGGEVDPEFRPKGIEASFAKITEEVRTQYTVGYYTHASPFDESFRKIEVRVLRPGLTVIAKEGYYPAASDTRRGAASPSTTAGTLTPAPDSAPAPPQ